MQYKSLALYFLISVSVLAGCTTPYGLGQTALRQGRYGEAVGHFEAVLAQDPNRLDALVGLGVSRYKLRDFDEAIGLAEDQLSALLGLKPEPRLAGVGLHDGPDVLPGRRADDGVVRAHGGDIRWS